VDASRGGMLNMTKEQKREYAEEKEKQG